VQSVSVPLRDRACGTARQDRGPVVATHIPMGGGITTDGEHDVSVEATCRRGVDTRERRHRLTGVVNAPGVRDERSVAFEDRVRMRAHQHRQ